MLIIPVGAKVIGHILNDLPIRTATFERFENLVQPLNSPLGAGKGAFLLKAWRAGQDDISKAAGFAEEDILHDEEVEFGESIAHVVRVRIDNAHLFADQVHGFEL